MDRLGQVLRLAAGEEDHRGALELASEVLALGVLARLHGHQPGVDPRRRVVLEPHAPPPAEHLVALRRARRREHGDGAGPAVEGGGLDLVRPRLELAGAHQQERSSAPERSAPSGEGTYDGPKEVARMDQPGEEHTEQGILKTVEAAGDVTVERALVGVVNGRDVTITQAGAGPIAAQGDVNIQQGGCGPVLVGPRPHDPAGWLRAGDGPRQPVDRAGRHAERAGGRSRDDRSGSVRRSRRVPEGHGPGGRARDDRDAGRVRGGCGGRGDGRRCSRGAAGVRVSGGRPRRACERGRGASSRPREAHARGAPRRPSGRSRDP